jgi:uncharacterized PurR-regulated membrane protein YhhQ (DUF165 family)
MLDKILGSTNRSLVYKLMALHIIIIAISNYIVQFKFNLFPGANLPLVGEFPLAAAAFTFPLVVVLTDLTARMLGRDTGRAVVALAVIPAIIASILVIGLGGAPWEKAFRIGLASGVAYGVGTTLDVYVFQHIRERWSDNWWLAPALSTVVANIIDTYTFFYTAFYPQPWVANVAFNNTVVKIIVGLVVFLPAYGIMLSWIQKKMSHNTAV